jgi:hypothetical protein
MKKIIGHPDTKELMTLNIDFAESERNVNKLIVTLKPEGFNSRL